jgi:hypothetical protein
MPNTVPGSDRSGAGGAFARLRGVTPTEWAAAVVGGFVGSIPLGLVMRYGNPEPLIELALPAMYGLGGPDPFAGWAIHQFHGVVLALLYVGAVQREPLATWAERYRGALGLAVAVVRTPTATLSVLVMPCGSAPSTTRSRRRSPTWRCRRRPGACSDTSATRSR